MKTEKIIVGEGTNYPLKGILALPDGEGKFPAVVFVHGSGASNMDEKVGKLTPFKDLAEGLAAQGVASIRYDKRSFAHGMKMMKEELTVRQETIEDAILAADLLRRDSRIDPEKIFIVGHSMGAMLAPRIDAEGGNFAGLVMMAGTLRTMEDVLFYQLREIGEGSDPLTRWILKGQIRKYEKQLGDIYEISDEEARKRKFGLGANVYYFKEMGVHPAKGYLEKTRKPMLIMQGGSDLQVKAELDFAGYQKLLGDRDNVSFKLYEGLNHCFVPAVCDSLAKMKKEFAKERHIPAEVIADLANWVKAQ